MKKNSGITLIALIITIIIMIVLVSISIAILINSDLMGKAQEAGEKTQEAYDEESRIGKGLNVKGKTYNNIDEYLASLKSKNFEAIMAEAKANRQGTEAIGIGTDGSIVDMDLWNYSEISGGGLSLGAMARKLF